MRTLFWCQVIRFRSFLRRAARHWGRHLRDWGGRLLEFGDALESRWDGALFSRLFQAELEIIGRRSRRYRGPIIGARFLNPPPGKTMLVALSLNWIAEGSAMPNLLAPNEWTFSGPCSIIIDPKESPLHKLEDGTFWFMMQGGYGVIRFSAKDQLSFAGSPEVKRVYTYF